MKNIIKISTIILIVFSGIINVAQAKIWRLNNNGGTPNPAIAADFTGTLQAAHDNASVVSGDTIHIEQSSTSYGACIFTKKLILIGAGYFLSSNSQTQVNVTDESTVGDLTFYNSASAGSSVSGLVTAIIYIGVNDVKIARNKVNYIRLGAASGTSPVISGIKILQNYLLSYASSSSIWNNGAAGGSVSVEIIGNIFSGTYSANLDSRVGGLFANNSINTLYNNLVLNNFTIKNNIQVTNASYGTTANTFGNCTVTYNIGSRDNLFVTPTTSGSMTMNNNQTKTLAQIAWTGTNDAYYNLPVTSSAIGQGEGGADCGSTAGSYPYKLSGIPAVPNIYAMSIGAVPAGATSISVTVSAKTNN